MQSCDLIAKSISANLSKMNKGLKIEETNYLYHVMKHIKATRCQSAYVDEDSLINDFTDDMGAIDTLAILKKEQNMLDFADGDELCLNNNEQAYVPVNTAWISEETKEQFLKWYAKRKR